MIDVSYGGVFSKIMMAIQGLAYLPDHYDNIYLNCIDARATKICNPFDYIFEQPKLRPGKYEISDVNTLTCGKMTRHDFTCPIENFPLFRKYKESVKRLVINKEMQDLIDQHKHLVSDPIIGVHIRMTDMHIHHENLGIYSVNNYLDFTKYHMAKAERENTNLFVASDNHESINAYIREYGDRVKFVPNMWRAAYANENTTHPQVARFSGKEMWQEAFLEMYLLSMCDTIICRTSDLSNVAKVYASKPQEYVWLPTPEKHFWKNPSRAIQKMRDEKESYRTEEEIKGEEFEESQSRFDRIRRTDRSDLYSRKILSGKLNKRNQ